MIYFLKRTDALIKIGYTNNYLQRLKQLQSEHGELVLLGWKNGAMAEEKELHRKFAECRVQGEWFNPTDELNTYIEAETNRATPDNSAYQPRNSTINEYLQAQIDDALKLERSEKISLAEQLKDSQREIIRLQAQVEMLEKLALKLQDHAIASAFEFIKAGKEGQIKRVS